MALVFPGKTKCALCGELLLDGEKIVGFPAFLPATHNLWRYSDAAFHESCYESWEHADHLTALYQRWNKIMDTRPAKMPPPEELAAWYAEAFKDFPGDEG